MKQNIKISLIEDSADYRHVIRLALEEVENMELINQYGIAEEGLRSLQDMQTRQVPDVLLLDLNLPGISGLQALPEFLRLIPDTKIIILTQSQNEADVVKAISLGALGYLLKSAPIEEIKAGIQTVVQGGASLDAQMATYLLKTIKKKPPKKQKITNLTQREKEILTLISKGFARKEIGDQLRISYNTVGNHIAHIFEKLNVQNAPEAVSHAYKHGLFSPDEE